MASRLNIFLVLLILLLGYLQYHLWFQKDGVRDLMALKSKIKNQTEANENLRKRNEEVMFQIQRLKQDNEGVESRARSELGMIKKGETFYQVINHESND